MKETLEDIGLAALFVSLCALAIAAVIGLLGYGIAYVQQQNLKVTCNIYLPLSKALWYDSHLSGCQRITINK